MKKTIVLIFVLVMTLLLCSCAKSTDSIYGLKIERNTSNCNYTEEKIIDTAQNAIEDKYFGYVNPSASYFADGNWRVFYVKEPIECDGEELQVVIDDSTGEVTDILESETDYGTEE